MAGHPLRYEHFEILTDAQGLPLRLGRGGMGATFRAYDTRLRRPAALKIINERSLANATMRRRFFNEARAAALIDHPNVARVLYLCPEDAEDCFFAMELIEGESLADLVARRGPLPAAEALTLLRPIVEALEALAAHHLIHRDLKPENIMITRGGAVKLIDFGVAKPLGGDTDRFELVQTDGHFVGSVYFASPEQVIATAPLDQRSDFYALGATLWHAATGAPPFTGTRYEVQEGHLHRAPDLAKVALAPRPFVALLARLLAKAPAERPADVAMLRAEWEAARVELEALAQRAAQAAPGDTVVDARPPPLACTRVDAAPPGCAAPILPARLAMETATGAWLAVREISYQVSAAVSAAFQQEARAVQAAPHVGLLAVREVRDERVVSEWRCGIPAAQLLAARRGGLPPEVVLGWLPAVAEATDWACARGFARTSFDPARWLVSFAALGENETPSQRAALPPEHWGPMRVTLDPLAGFEADLSALQTNIELTEAPARHDAPRSAADFLAALARALHELLGGHLDRENSPLPALNEPRNDLLRAALERRSGAVSATAWAQAFIAAGGDDRPRAGGISAPVSAVPDSPKPGSRLAFAVAAVAACVLGASAAGFWLFSRAKPSPAGSTESPSPLLTATTDAPFTNGLGMEFVPVSISGPDGLTRVLFCRHETRRSDYAAFAAAVPGLSDAWRAPEVSGVKMPTGTEADAHPAINVSWEDAAAFCAWLTARERREHRLRADELYRLPTDHEWSCAAGLGDREDAARPPKEKSGALADLYPWGRGFLPPNPAAAAHQKLPGNYAGEESRGAWVGIIEGYADEFIGTAPVRSFAPNAAGLHDLGGNAWEWCQDEWSPGSKTRILRGASCINSRPNLLNVSFRKATDGARADLSGFRCVLAAPLPPE